jgi:hypothetical protein
MESGDDAVNSFVCINELLTVVMLPGLLPIPVIVFEYFPRLFNKTENCFFKLFFHFLIAGIGCRSFGRSPS